MYEHTIIARQLNGIVVSKMAIQTERSCGFEVAASQEANKLACEKLGVSEINLSFLIGSTKEIA
jgi:hypothetical protein